MKTALKHETWIKAPATKVYQAISTAEGIGTWWEKQRAVETNGNVVLEHNPGPEHGVVKMKVLDLVKDKRVEWECISTHPATSPASAWTGTHVVFEIARRMVPPWASSKREITALQFNHSGWDEDNEYLGFCNFAWGQVLEKLKEVCESQ